MLVLDTHVLIWLLEGSRQIRVETLDAIELSAAANQLHVSAIVFWEIGLLEASGRLRLRESFSAWRHRAKEITGIAIAPVTEDVAVDSTRLPGEFHRDPADRFMVATAREMSATLVTRDRRILRYAEQGHVQVMAA